MQGHVVGRCKRAPKCFAGRPKCYGQINTICLLLLRSCHAVNDSELTLPQYETLADKRIVVAIDSWEADSLYPSGHYTRTLGPIGDRDTETEVQASLRTDSVVRRDSGWHTDGQIAACRGGRRHCDMQLVKLNWLHALMCVLSQV